VLAVFERHIENCISIAFDATYFDSYFKRLICVIRIHCLLYCFKHDAKTGISHILIASGVIVLCIGHMYSNRQAAELSQRLYGPYNAGAARAACS